MGGLNELLKSAPQMFTLRNCRIHSLPAFWLQNTMPRFRFTYFPSIGIKRAGEEQWKKCKYHGCLLETEEDIKRGKVSATDEYN